MYPTVEAVWKDNHLEPLESIKVGKNLRYLITVIDDGTEKQSSEKNKRFGFIQAQKVLKHYTGSLSTAVIEERERAR